MTPSTPSRTPRGAGMALRRHRRVLVVGHLLASIDRLGHVTGSLRRGTRSRVELSELGYNRVLDRTLTLEQAVADLQYATSHRTRGGTSPSSAATCPRTTRGTSWLPAPTG